MSDLISKELFDQIKWERDIAIGQLKELGYGLGEKIRTDKDTISRQAAIDELMKRDKALRNINWYDKPFAEGECKGIDDALEIINALPSAQPEDWMEQNKDRILKAGMEGREIEFRIGGRLFAIREKAQ